MTHVHPRLREKLPMELRHFVRRKFKIKPTFQDSYRDWQEANADSTGYDSEEIALRVLAAIREVQCGAAAYERDSVIFPDPDHAWPTVAGLMIAAATDGGVLRVLDFGGSLGSAYFQYRTFLSGLAVLQWNVVEQEIFAGLGRENIFEDALSFHSSIEDALTVSSPNIVHFGSSLQYLERPFETIQTVNDCGSKFLLIDRTPMSKLDHDLVTVQTVPREIYPASYPAWVFSRKRLISELESEWRVVGEFESLGGSARTTSGIEVQWRGLLCSRKSQ